MIVFMNMSYIEKYDKKEIKSFEPDILLRKKNCRSADKIHDFFGLRRYH